MKDKELANKYLDKMLKAFHEDRKRNDWELAAYHLSEAKRWVDVLGDRKPIHGNGYLSY